MLRYRPTEIRLTPQEIDATFSRLAARPRQGAATAASTGPRIRRGPRRLRDDSLVHPSATAHPPPCTAERVPPHPDGHGPEKQAVPQCDGCEDTESAFPVWFHPKLATTSPGIGDIFNMAQLNAALGNSEAIPSIRLPSPQGSRHHSPKRHSLPILPSLPSFGPLVRSSSLGQASEHSSCNASRTPSFRLSQDSTPDLLLPLLKSTASTTHQSRQTSVSSSVDNSSENSAAILDLIRQDLSPLDRLEQGLNSEIPHAPSARSSRASSIPRGELRMPLFNSPERRSPQHRRFARFRNTPTFAELPSASPAYRDGLSSQIGFEPSSPVTSSEAFVDRYPGNDRNYSLDPRQSRLSVPIYGATSMPSLHLSRPSRRRASGYTLFHTARNNHGGGNPWVRGGEGMAETRRNTISGQRHRAHRSVSARMLPPWQDEQENSGRAEHLEMMAEAQVRRRYVEQTDNGRLDRTPPGLGRFERRIFQE
ncbi:uncharacterized protein K452DRAFT_87710 [Aplosporella prunicola CBS 121167]|uniref:Uncharacterized protein n=1 Tax=Aplosporella prunicola CBS 121167 TaxID=1176127 RepID=A0A6A6B5K5_9PEZI|nr:uncharacterized protein K452DRAFT_87710 [Aplosporella prunicola CBS 121167]KAF2138524.1 hypothetical protein K452DRAFT_87710 [Aplosporella prunicola CBS 121167]